MRQRLSLKARALQLLAQREHSRLELRRKLLAHAERLARNEFDAASRANEHDESRPGGGSRDADSPATRTRRAPPSAQTQQEVDALLDQLAASGTLSESRFVETRIRAHAARQGNLRIAQELARHGLELSASDAQDLKASEYARAKDVWQRKFAAPPTDAAGRARQMRFLAARGFSSDIIRRLLRGADDDE